MSRFLLACSLVTALSATAAADRAEPSFARPPAGWRAQHAGAAIDRDIARAGIVDRAAVRAKLAEQRAANLARFRAYRTAGVYPSNVYTPGLANVWRDQGGHYCAAATIIRASGEASLVAAIAEQDNFIKLAEVTSGPLLDWILTSGLTQAELALIQRPFMPVTKRPEQGSELPIVVDAGLRAAESRRLAKLYAEIDARLVASQKASLDRATDRLMQHPEIAAAFLAH